MKIDRVSSDKTIANEIDWDKHCLNFSMDMEDFNDPVKRESLMRDVVLEDRKKWYPNDNSGVSSFSWTAKNNKSCNAEWLNISISSCVVSPKGGV